MKKKLFGAILSAALTITMATPAFAGIIWTPDQLPAGYTTNEWENKDFYLNAGNAVKRDTYTYYIKDLHGNFMNSAVFANGSTTNAEGVVIDGYGHVSNFGTELGMIEYFNAQPYEHRSWQQDASKPLNDNGISNYWYGHKVDFAHSQWEWLMVSPEGKQDGMKYAYCFNEYGYLYTNTITPDGYQVNALGQLMIDGKVMTRKPNDVTPWYGFVRFPIGALGYDYDSSEKAAQLWGTPNPYF